MRLVHHLQLRATQRLGSPGAARQLTVVVAHQLPRRSVASSPAVDGVGCADGDCAAPWGTPAANIAATVSVRSDRIMVVVSLLTGHRMGDTTRQDTTGSRWAAWWTSVA